MTAKRVDWILAIGGTLALACWALLLRVGLFLGAGIWPMPHPRPDVPGPSFRVAVLGDTQKGIGNLRNLLEELKKEKIDLILHTGDLVATNDEGHYRLAAAAFRRSELVVPLAVVPGNHDIKGDPRRFEATVGPLESSFRRGQVSFIVVNNASGAPPDLARLEARVAEAPHEDAVVLAMHVPPFDDKGGIRAGFGPFAVWLEQSRVRYLCCGHVHGYVRREIGRTVVIANGVGGDYESWQFDQKVCATILEVEGTAIRDRSIELPPSHGIVANLEHFAAGHLARMVHERLWIAQLVTSLLTLIAGYAFLRLWLRARRARRGPAAP